MLPDLPWEFRSLQSLHSDGVTTVDPLQFGEELFEYYSIPAYQNGTRPVTVKGSTILSQKLQIPPRCVLFGKLNPRVEKVWLVNSETPHRRLASTEWLPIVPLDDANPAFLYYVLFSHWVMPIAQSLVSGSTPSRERVEPRAFYQIQVPFPPRPEQEKIAAVLWKIQRAIEAEQKLVATARELKRSAMRQLFTYGLRKESTRETPFGEVPKTWAINPLVECAYVQTGATKGRVISPEDAIDVPYLRVANVQDGHLDLKEMKTIRIRRDELDGYRLRKDDVVLTEGGDFDKLGRGFIWDGQIDPCIHQNHVFAVRVNRELLWPRYFAYLAQSPYGKSYFLTVAHKTTNLACINTTKLRAFPVARPELNDQREIAAILQTIDRKISVHDRKRATLQGLFQTMLHQLMTAQIRVDKLDIDTTEVAMKP